MRSIVGALLFVAHMSTAVQAREAEDVFLKAGASGVWCDGRMSLAVELENRSADPLYIALPSAAQQTWPFLYDISVDQGRTSTGETSLPCACSDGGDCRLCGDPAVVVELLPGASRAWRILLTKQNLRKGRLRVEIAVSWYGSRTRARARHQIMRARSTVVLALQRTTRRCFQPTEVSKRAG